MSKKVVLLTDLHTGDEGNRKVITNGTTVEVSDEQAEHWVNIGSAKYADGEQDQLTPDENPEDEQ